MAEDLILKERLSDVVLKVRHNGYSWRIPAHSLILKAGSSLFHEKLEERATDSHSSPITLVELHPDTVLAMLRYMYSGTIPTSISANLLVNTKKYGMDDLRHELENIIIPNITVPQACQMLDGLEHEQPGEDECGLKMNCLKVLEDHAYRVFSSDLVLSLSRKTLLELLKSDKLNVPDESSVFWGIWAWGLCHSSRNGRTIDAENVASYIEDMLSLLRSCSLRRKEGIPIIALHKFQNKTAGMRCRFFPPDDSLEQSNSMRTVGTWEEIFDASGEEDGNLCIQVSFDKDVMLVGVTLETCNFTNTKGHLRIFEENSGRELLRQEMNCGYCVFRKLSRTGEPEPWTESDIVLYEPLIFRRSEICSIYLTTSPDTPWALPRASIRSRNKKIESTLGKLHGQYVAAIRELYIIPDMTVTWGVRR